MYEINPTAENRCQNLNSANRDSKHIKFSQAFQDELVGTYIRVGNIVTIKETP